MNVFISFIGLMGHRVNKLPSRHPMAHFPVSVPSLSGELPSRHNSLGALIPRPFRGFNPRMPLALTRQEKRIIAVLALLIVLGLVGMAVL